VILSDIQATLQQRYDVNLSQRVDEFFCNDGTYLRHLTGCQLESPEALLIHEDKSNLDVTLFIDPMVMDGLAAETLQQAWLKAEFDDVCIALEGVSHFVYLVWNAGFGKSVKLLEMEIQAEVDKFVLAADRLGSSPAACEVLLQRLFHQVEFRKQSSIAAYERYVCANELAQRYCEWLTDTFTLQADNDQLSAELARFYRMSHRQKLVHIRSRPAKPDTLH